MESKVDFYSNEYAQEHDSKASYYDERFCNGKIFKVKNWYNDKYYYGATIQPLGKALSRIKGCSKTRTGGIYDLLKEYPSKGFFIEEVEAYPCSTQRELDTRLNDYIKAAGEDCINRAVPCTSPSPPPTRLTQQQTVIPQQQPKHLCKPSKDTKASSSLHELS